MSAFEVLPYSVEALVQCLADGSKLTSESVIRNKRHRVYFEEYFQALEAATIVVERAYTDRDYLEDYAAYYDRCFQEYPRRTQRLHFFSAPFDAAQFELTLGDPNAGVGEQGLRETYLGFVVVKPLPQTIVGRTCLKTYSSDNGRRHFPSLRIYPVNLFGIELEVESLAYQEQDTVVAACATSALWSCFQGTGKLFQHMIPPPVEITGWAGSHMPENLLAASSRAFPNNGLTATQMAHAVRRVGLEPLVLGTNTRYGLNGAVYAYLRGKIPSILAAELVKDAESPQSSIMGGHAIALTGFSLGDEHVTGYGESGFLLRAARIDKIYGHDDQVGPFARMVWEKIEIPVPSEELVGSSSHEAPDVEQVDQPGPKFDSFEFLRTSWAGSVHAVPKFVLLPLYHKIRIPFSLVHEEMLRLDALIENLRQKAMPTVPRAEWDIYLTTSGDFKASARVDYAAIGIPVTPSLIVDLPRFVWRVTVRTSERFQLDFLFDATGIAQHGLLVHVVSADAEYAQMLGALAPFCQASPESFSVQVRSVLERFLASPIPAA